jgi:predicted regulator of Ras-like GTPase activity (Roadblock/LC7/MglB family)
MFADLLASVVSRMPGLVGVTVMGFDGIAIESQAGREPGDWQSAFIEMGSVASQLQRISENMGTGAVEELVVKTGTMTTVLRPLTSEYFVGVTLSPGANTGKARYLLRLVGPKLAAELV